MKLSDIERVVAILREKNVPPLKDGRYVVQVHPDQEATAMDWHERGLITLGRVVDGEWVPLPRRK